jgi:hypothetical protein
MHFHLPKPLHGWREFVGEIAIIVIAISIALAAEQAVAAHEWNLRVSEARSALNQEIADAAASAKERVAFQSCAPRHLNDVQARLMGAGLTIEKPLLVSRYFTIIRPWSQNVWRTMSGSGVLEHMPQQEMLEYSATYDVIASIREELLVEQDSISDLSLLTTLHGRFDPITRDRLLMATSRARRENSTIVRDSRQLLEAANHLGVTPTEYVPIPCYSLDQRNSAIPQ